MKVKFYLKSSHRNPVMEFLFQQSEDLRSDFTDAIDRLSNGEVLKMPLSRNLSGIYPGLHELRLKDRSGQIRVFYWIKRGEAIFILHAFRKKNQRVATE